MNINIKLKFTKYIYFDMKFGPVEEKKNVVVPGRCGNT